jgi:hypothetical protein
MGSEWKILSFGIGGVKALAYTTTKLIKLNGK